MSNIDARVRIVIQHLLRLTSAGRIDWESVGSGNSASPKFAASLEESTFVVSAADGSGSPPHSLELRNSWGEVVERVSTQKIRSITAGLAIAAGVDDDDYASNSEGARIFNRSLRDLYEHARRKALNVDEFLDSVINELEDQGE